MSGVYIPWFGPSLFCFECATLRWRLDLLFEHTTDLYIISGIDPTNVFSLEIHVLEH